jgi:hypothetical protein
MGLKAHRFASVEKIQHNATNLRVTAEEDFQRCFQQWQDRWSKSVCEEGMSFEDDYLRFFTWPL